MGAREFGGYDLLAGIKQRAVAEAVEARMSPGLTARQTFEGVALFRCDRLRADISQATCTANYARATTGSGCISCRGCPIGKANQAPQPPQSKPRGRRNIDDCFNGTLRKNISCIRCGKDNYSAGRLLGRMRIVRGEICVSCFNREAEVIAGRNSKGDAPKLHAALTPATVTIERDGLREALDADLRLSRPEVERWVERFHAGAKIIEVTLGGAVVEPGTPEHKVYRYASASEPAPAPEPPNEFKHDDTDYFGKHVQPRSGWKRKPAMTPEQALAYEREFEDDGDSRKPVVSETPEHVGSTSECSGDSLGMYPWSGLPEIADYLDDGVDALVRYLLADDIAEDAAAAQPVAPDANSRRPRRRKIADISGQTFGMLTAIEHTGFDTHRNAMWRFTCACGGEKITQATSAKTGRIRSCGCLGRGPCKNWIADKIIEHAAASDDGQLTWGGKTLAHWSDVTGTDVYVLAARLTQCGTPFLDTRKAVRPAPVPATQEKAAVSSEPAADTVASAKPVESAVDASAQREADPIERFETDGGATEMRCIPNAAVEPVAQPDLVKKPESVHTSGASVHPLNMTQPDEQPRVSIVPAGPKRQRGGKKAAKAARRAEREARAQQTAQPAMKARPAAIAARAMTIVSGSAELRVALFDGRKPRS
jgi:hypothetical protein